MAEGLPPQRHVVARRHLVQLRARELHLRLGDVELRRQPDPEAALGEIEVLLVVGHRLVGDVPQSVGGEQPEVRLLDVEHDRVVLRRRVGRDRLGAPLCRVDEREVLPEVEQHLREGHAGAVEVERRRAGTAEVTAGRLPLLAWRRVAL